MYKQEFALVIYIDIYEEYYNISDRKKLGNRIIETIET